MKRIAWTVEGADWKEQIYAPKDSLPAEIATRVIENIYNSKFLSEDFQIGMILMVSHEEMSSVDEMYVCYTPTILANAGKYAESKFLQQSIDNLLKQ